jgi:hypothetical protein
VRVAGGVQRCTINGIELTFHGLGSLAENEIRGIDMLESMKPLLIIFLSMLTFLVFGTSTVNVSFDLSPRTKQLRERSCAESEASEILKMVRKRILWRHTRGRFHPDV